MGKGMVPYLIYVYQIIKIKIIIMFDNFDDLYNDFFRKKGGDDKHLDKMKKLMEDLNNFDDLSGIPNPHEEELGEPSEVVTYVENGHTFEKKTWDLPHGQMVRVRMVNSPLDPIKRGGGVKITKAKRSLKQELELALSEERYEDAIAIRDEMSGKKKGTKKKSKK